MLLSLRIETDRVFFLFFLLRLCCCMLCLRLLDLLGSVGLFYSRIFFQLNLLIQTIGEFFLCYFLLLLALMNSCLCWLTCPICLDYFIFAEFFFQKRLEIEDNGGFYCSLLVFYLIPDSFVLVLVDFFDRLGSIGFCFSNYFLVRVRILDV